MSLKERHKWLVSEEKEILSFAHDEFLESRDYEVNKIMGELFNYLN